jgi:hypothetical protein
MYSPFIRRSHPAPPGFTAANPSQHRVREQTMGSLAVTAKNDSSHDIFISGDPNWDDQELTFDGQSGKRSDRLAPGSSVVVGISIDYNEMGVIFSGAPDYDSNTWAYQLSLGLDPESGNQSVTDTNSWGSPTVEYVLQDQKPLSMTMLFVDLKSS